MTRLLIAILALAAMAGVANATPAFAQKEKKNCVFCHTRPSGGGRFLNEAGKWYKLKKTLVGFPPKATKPTPKKPTPAPKKKPAAKKK